MCKERPAAFEIDDLTSPVAAVKYDCARRAMALAEQSPQELLPYFDKFAQLLQSDKNVLKWTGLRVIGYLASVADREQIVAVLPELKGKLGDPMMITAANAVQALTEIGRHHPDLAGEIVKAWLGVEKVDYYQHGEISPECRNVALGHVLKGLAALGDAVLARRDVQSFLKRQTENSRPQVQKLATKLLAVRRQVRPPARSRSKS